MARTPKKPASHRSVLLPKHLQLGSHKAERALATAAQAYFDLELVPSSAAPTLLAWCFAYMHTRVIGIQADNTEQAKRRDLSAFLGFYGSLNGHLEIEQWLSRDSAAFLKHLEKQGRGPSTINRHFRTLRHFARWVHEQPSTPFAVTGLPTNGIKELAVEEPEPKKLGRREVLRLFKAADRLVLTETRGFCRPRRDRALLALLYYTGLRVTELVNLQMKQWDGKRFENVRRKANVRTKSVYVHPEARRYLQEYLDDERSLDTGSSDHVFLPRGGRGPMARFSAFKVLRRIAEEASAHGEPIHMHPHRLRHTFGFELSARGVQPSEIARHLGHQGLKYVGRYTQPSQEEREALLDTLEVG